MCSSVKDVQKICTISVAASISNISVTASASVVSSSITTTASLSVARAAAALTGAGGGGQYFHFCQFLGHNYIIFVCCAIFVALSISVLYFTTISFVLAMIAMSSALSLFFVLPTGRPALLRSCV